MDNEITFEVIDREGQVNQIQGPTDMSFSLMEICRASDLPIEGTCGGMALCASCHCYINSDHALPPKGPDEEAMLSEALHVKENSRLTCQIPLTQALDGLSITIAPES